MASQARATADDGRRTGLSPRPRGRDNTKDKDILCKNITIYGHCRWEKQGCSFNHDPNKARNNTESTKKRLNVDSPSFTPLSSSPNLSVNGLATKPTGLSPKVANAAPFKPKGFNNAAESFGKKQYNPAAPDWSMAASSDISEFISQAQTLTPNIQLACPEQPYSTYKLDPQEMTRINMHPRSQSSSPQSSSSPPYSFRLPPDLPVPPDLTYRSCSPEEPRWEGRLGPRATPERPYGLVADYLGVTGPPQEWETAQDPFAIPASAQRRVQSCSDSPQRRCKGSSWRSSSLPFAHPALQHSFSCDARAHYILQGDPSTGMAQGLYDSYVASSTSMGNAASNLHQSQLNPYTADQSTNGANTFFQGNAFAHLPQYHLYTSQAPHRENLTPQQRLARDFFIPDHLREELQRKSAAQLQVMQNANLPSNIDFFHTIVPLDTNHQRNTALFGYPSWMYKAVSGNDGKHYALRRVEGFRLNDDRAMLPIKTAWKRIVNANVVTIIDAFTNRSFGDSALFLVTDYHPLSKTLAETHLGQQHHGGGRFSNRQSQHTPVTEQILWAYMFQISNALRAIHAAGLAARVLDPSKILLTSKNRIRLNGCGILDVVQWGPQGPNPADLQRDDFVQFGKLILQLGLNAPKGIHNIAQSLDQFGRNYSAALKERVSWLLGFINLQRGMESIDSFIQGLTPQMTGAFDAALHEADQLTTELGRELENGRLVRLMTKLNFITERPDFNHERGWSENGERYPIKLFRDWVFHQVDARGNPRLDLAHVLSCLNKLDAGSEERMTLISRDEQTCIVVSYREIKRAVDSAYQELAKASRRSGNM